MNNRESGPDILRCMAVFFVTGLHAFLYIGFYDQPQVGVGIWLADCLRWLFFGCIGIFMMLTGYLKSAKKPDRRYWTSLIPILIGYALTCVISYPIRHFLLGEKLSLLEWLKNFCTFSNYAWYIEMYIGLLLISPLLNLALEKLQTPRQLIGFAIAALCVTGLPSIAEDSWFPDYWEALYPFTYYILGAVIRRLQPKLPPLLCIGMALAWIGTMGAFSVFSTDGTFTDGFVQEYGDFWVTVMVFLVFLCFYRIRLAPRPAKIMAWLSGGCFEGYILSRLFDVWIYDQIPQWHRTRYFPLALLCITVPVFFISVLAGKGTHFLAEQLSKPLRKQVLEKTK